MAEVAVFYCDDCARPNPVWFAPSDLWNYVVGGPDAAEDPGGMLCPCCFIVRAEAAGVVPSAWVLTEERPSLQDDAQRETERPVRAVDRGALYDHAERACIAEGIESAERVRLDPGSVSPRPFSHVVVDAVLDALAALTEENRGTATGQFIKESV